MMNEKPLEWMVEYGESIGHKIGRIASLAAAIMLFLLFLMSGQLFMLIGLVIFGVLFAWLQIHAFVEYEFCYFSDEVDVAAIYNRARRKKKMHFRLADVEYMVKKIETGEVTKYFCDKSNVGGIYTLMMNLDNKRTAVVMEADPAFVKAMEMKRKVR